MSLRSFIRQMEKKGEVVHVRDQVSPKYAVSSIMKAFDGGPILRARGGRIYSTKKTNRLGRY